MSGGRSATPSTCQAGLPVRDGDLVEPARVRALLPAHHHDGLHLPGEVDQALLTALGGRAARLVHPKAGDLPTEDLRDAQEPVARKGRLPHRDARPRDRDRLGLVLGGDHEGRGRVPPDALDLDVRRVADDDDSLAAGRVIAHQLLHPQDVGAGGVHAGHAFPLALTALPGPDAVGPDDDDAADDLGQAVHRHHAPATVLLHHPRVVNERAEGVHGLARVFDERPLHDRERPLHAPAGPERRGPDDGHG